MSKFYIADTITARATPPGFGGVSIIRISGPDTQKIIKAIVGKVPKPRYAEYQNFLSNQNEIIDKGLVLFFPNPHSFTGEDVAELQGHGGPLVTDKLLKRIIELGARLARPGEFSERAYLNDKIDLVQAEAIADLINSTTEEAVKSAVASLQGDFSKKIDELVTKILYLRTYVEAAIDFAEEEIDFLNDGIITEHLNDIKKQMTEVLGSAKQGALIREGISIVITGKPNAGKSSLLNQLSGKESAIVTDIPGTTRDLLKEHIAIKGVPVHIIDTAGLRESDDLVEQEGVRRAKSQFKEVDRIFLMIDSSEYNDKAIQTIIQDYLAHGIIKEKLTLIYNKIDKIGESPRIDKGHDIPVIHISAKNNLGIQLLQHHILECAGYQEHKEGVFLARRRHLTALNKASHLLEDAISQFQALNAGELLGEDLKEIQAILGEITGQITTDDLLGEIFSSFCVGK